MKLIEPSVELIWVTPDAERIIELSGRTCYKSENNITEYSHQTFIKNVILNHHESVLEHASASIRFITDRGVSHELVRHRLMAVSQESQRYCSYGKDKFDNQITFINQNDLVGKDYEDWYECCSKIEMTYLDLVNKGIRAEIARSILPNCTKTELIVTANFRQWRHMFKLRRSPASHPHMRHIMDKAYECLRIVSPNVFNDIF